MEKYIQACLFLEFLKILEDNPNPLINEEGLEMLAGASAKLNKINFENALHTKNVSLETFKDHLALLAETEYNHFVEKSEKIHQMGQFLYQSSQTAEQPPCQLFQIAEQPPQKIERPSCQLPLETGHPDHNFSQFVENPPYQPYPIEERPFYPFSHNNQTFLEDDQEVFLKPLIPFWHQYQNNSPEKALEPLMSDDNFWDNT